MAYLIETSGKSRKKYRLDNKVCSIGRHPDCQIVLDDNAVSRRHAEIRERNGQFFLVDLNSRNGTLVNKELIHQETLLFDNSEIEVCDFVFSFQLDEGFSHVRPKPTVAEAGDKKSVTNFILDDIPSQQSSIRRQLELPSKYMGTRGHQGDQTSGTFYATGDKSIERKLAALVTVTQALRDAHEPQAIMQHVMNSLFDLFVDADRGFVAMKDAEGKIFPFAMKTRREQDSEKVRISRTIVNQVLESQQAILSSDAAADQRFDLSQSMADLRIRSLMCAPLINSEGEAIGAIQLDTLRSAIAFDDSDLEVLVTAAMQASLALQNVELYKKVERSRKIDEDLKLAHEVQQRFLPQRNPDTPAYQFYSYYLPMSQVGGDYFDFIQLDESRLGIIVADVVGHGIAAAMLMAKISAESRFAIALNSDPVAAISQVNRNLSNLNIDKFVTLVLGLFDLNQHTLTIVNAGHMLPILMRADGNISELNFDGAGLPLGILDDAEYGSFTIKLEPGDSVVFYTDGVNESMNEAGDQLGIDNLLEELRIAQAKTPETIGKAICHSIKRHVGGYDQIDDICIVVVGRHK